MCFEFIGVRKEGRITIITIRRPDVYNALNTKAHLELEQAFDAFAEDEESWVAIITGAGQKAFCAGHDLKQQDSGEGLVLPRSGFGGLTSRFDLHKPVIAAVNGFAFGGGFEIALACDVIIASDTARFALPQALVGLAPLAGGIHRLHKSLGEHRAKLLLLTGRQFTAQEAYNWGLVSEVVRGADIMLHARRVADDILACSPLAVRACKQALRNGASKPLDDALQDQWTLPSIETMMASDDAAEGVRAFVEKRSPQWTGR